MACGTGAALCWALGFVAARHGIDVGLSPLVLALHRFVRPGLVLLPFVANSGWRNLDGIGWGHGFALAVFGGLPLALLSYLGYLFVPLGHGGIIQPSCAALGGMILARVVLKEPLPARRVVGALVIVIGLAVIGAEAFRTIGAHGVGGDFLFVAAGCFFAVFGMLVRRWRVAAMQAVAVTSILSLVGLPILLFTFDNMVAAGFWENLFQAVVQGTLNRPGRPDPFAELAPSHCSAFRGRRYFRRLTVRAADRVRRAGHRAERLATCRIGDRRRRLPADAAGVRSSRLAGSQKLSHAVERPQNIFGRIGVRKPHITFTQHAKVRPADHRDAGIFRSALASVFAFQPVRLMLGNA